MMQSAAANLRASRDADVASRTAALASASDFIRAGGLPASPLIDAAWKVMPFQFDIDRSEVSTLTDDVGKNVPNARAVFGGKKDIFAALATSTRDDKDDNLPSRTEKWVDASLEFIYRCMFFTYSADAVSPVDGVADMEPEFRHDFCAPQGTALRLGALSSATALSGTPSITAREHNLVNSQLFKFVAGGSLLVLVSGHLPAGANCVSLTAAQRRRSVEIVHRAYLIFPQARKALRVQLARVIIETLRRSSNKVAPVGRRAGAGERNQLQVDTTGAPTASQVRRSLRDINQHVGTFNSTLPLMGRGRGRGQQLAMLQQAAGSNQHFPSFDAGNPSSRLQAGIYATASDIENMASLNVLLPLLESIVAGLENPLDQKHGGMFIKLFDNCLRLTGVSGQVDEFTSLLSNYVAELSRCFVAFCVGDQTGSLLERFVQVWCETFELFVEQMGRSKVAITLVHPLEEVLAAVRQNTLLFSENSHQSILGVLCGRLCLESPNFTVMQRGLILLKSDDALDCLLFGSGRELSKSEDSSGMRIASALARGFGTMFSHTTKLMCFRALVRIADRVPAVARWRVYKGIVQQCDQWKVTAEQEEQERYALMSTPRNDLTFMRLAWNKNLGSGAFGTVRSAVVISPGTPQHTWPEYAIKTVTKLTPADASDAVDAVPLLRAEIELLQRCSESPYIIKFISSFEDEKRSFLALELAEKGDIFDIIRNAGSVSTRWAQYVVVCVANALHFLHGAGFVHFDVKPENLLVMHNGVVKLADLGSALKLTDPGVGQPYVALTGTAEYTAYELVADALSPAASDFSKATNERLHFARASLISPAVDWWALGCVLYQLLQGRPPYVAPSTSDGSPSAVFQVIHRMAKITGPLFAASPIGSAIDEQARIVTKALLNCNTVQRLNPFNDDSGPLSAFFELDTSLPPPEPGTGSVAAAQVDVQLKQRKFSMLATSMTQFTTDASSTLILEPISEMDGF